MSSDTVAEHPQLRPPIHASSAYLDFEATASPTALQGMSGRAGPPNTL